MRGHTFVAFVLSSIVCLILAVNTSLAQKPELVVQTGHSSSIWTVAFSPDGKTLAERRCR